jgi:hypothetical protein
MKSVGVSDPEHAAQVVAYYNVFAAAWNARELDPARQRGADVCAQYLVAAHGPRIRGPLFSPDSGQTWYSIDAPIKWTVFVDDRRFGFLRNFIQPAPLPLVWRYPGMKGQRRASA